MAAKLVCYATENCAEADKLPFQTAAYHLTLGPEAGLDGDAGEVYAQSIWVKNEGNYPALGAIVIKLSDTNKYVYTTTDITPITSGRALVGDLAVGEIKKITFTTSIPRYTKLSTVNLSIRIDYYTHP